MSLGAARLTQMLPGSTPQFAAPVSDVSDGTWTTDTGGSSLFAAVDETAADDGDYIQSSVNPSSDAAVLALTALDNPLSSVGHYVRYRIRRG